jgi:hypothetical protein
LEKANLELWKLDSFSSFISDVDFFIFLKGKKTFDK